MRLEAFNRGLARFCTEEAEALDRLVMISFDHAHLKALKAEIPEIRTAGIVHEHFSDPVMVARSSDLNELCIDLDVFDPEQARALHAAGIAIRCHAYRPEVFAKGERAGLGWSENLARWVNEGLIDTLSGDDVAWVVKFLDGAGAPRRR